MSNKANNNNNEKQVENFTTVWDSVRRAKTVNGLQFKAIDKLLYSYLLGWQVSKDDPNNKKVTKVNSSVRELQQELGVSKGTIETSLKTLEKMGLIVIKSGGVGFSNEYDVRKFSDVESTNVEIKVDQFMENRKEYRAEKQNNKGWGYESGNEAKVDTVETPHDANAEEYRDSEIKVVDVEPESKTLWQLHSHALITQNPKFNDLSPGHQSSVMSELSECNAVSYKAIKEIFNMSVAQFAKAEVSKQTIKQVGRVCSGCYPVEVGNGWSCINNKCSNHNAEYENSKLDDMDSIPF